MAAVRTHHLEAARKMETYRMIRVAELGSKPPPPHTNYLLAWRMCARHRTMPATYPHDAACLEMTSPRSRYRVPGLQVARA